MPRVLLVDGDPVSLTAMRRLMERERFEVIAAPTGRIALDSLASFSPDAIVIDCVLPDMPTLEFVRSLDGMKGRCILISRFGYDREAARAKAIGICACIEQPLSSLALRSTVKSVASGMSFAETTQSYALSRWVDVVLRGACSPADLTTLQAWSRFVGASAGTIRNWCRTARLPPRMSLQFTRGLRAVLLQVNDPKPPEDLLDIVDRRTLTKFARMAGGSVRSLPSSLDEYLARQRFISEHRALLVVRSSLKSKSQGLAE